MSLRAQIYEIALRGFKTAAPNLVEAIRLHAARTMADRVARLVEPPADIKPLLARLRAPVGRGGTNSEDAYEKFDDLRLEAADAIERLAAARGGRK